MTTVYGVTKYGAKHQIAKQLKGKFHFSMYAEYLDKKRKDLRYIVTNQKEMKIYFNIHISCRYAKLSKGTCLVC